MRDSGLSVYAVAKGAGVSREGLGRFMRRDRRSIEAANKPLEFFQMRLSRAEPREASSEAA